MLRSNFLNFPMIFFLRKKTIGKRPRKVSKPIAGIFVLEKNLEPLLSNAKRVFFFSLSCFFASQILPCKIWKTSENKWKVFSSWGPHFLFIVPFCACRAKKRSGLPNVFSSLGLFLRAFAPEKGFFPFCGKKQFEPLEKTDEQGRAKRVSLYIEMKISFYF